MPKEIRLNAFEQCCVGFVSQGLWAHPADQALRYHDLDYWVDVAKTLEKGLFDGIFFADMQGAPDVYGGDAEAALRTGAFMPLNDPLMIISAVSHATRHIGFGVTYNLTSEAPYILARRMSTLDHITRGRIAWNVVTGAMESAAKGLGLAELMEHDLRYAVADEYMEIVYKLWEGSWEDTAVVRDRERRIFADPKKVHKIVHQGTHFKMEGIHLCEPSPQRTPVLYQAGASDRGRDFAARHAECVFVNGLSSDHVREKVHAIRGQAVSYGRKRDDILFFLGITVIVGETEEEAFKTLKEYQEYVSEEGSLVALSAVSGVDFASQANQDETVKVVATNAAQSVLPAYAADRWSAEKIATHIGGRGPVLVGDPIQVADEMQRWIREADLDGFNLGRAVTPQTIKRFVDLVVPELQRRGAYKKSYSEGTLREKMFEGAPKLNMRHPGTQFRISS